MSLSNKSTRPATAQYGVLLLVIILCPLLSVPALANPTDQLIIFVQLKSTAVATAFESTQLPEIKKISEYMGIPVKIMDASKGAPPEVTITPMMILQNHRGRSTYQGRTTTPDRIRNFIRTARVIPQKEVPYHREKTPVWEIGRARVWAPLKVSGVTGTEPKGYDKARFIQESLDYIVKGFKHLKLQDSVDLARGDRGFYMDFYPWRAQDGTLFLSLALYSQFHCKEPIFKTKEKPLTGPWQDRHKLFEKAAALMEAEVQKHMENPDGGDGFDPVPKTTPLLSWQTLGLSLPKAPESINSAAHADIVLPTRWKIAPQETDDVPPLILFRFPAPLDLYRGEVITADGQLTLPDSRRLNGAKGFIEVDTRSAVTMGDPVLNEAIQGSLILYSYKYPTSRFDITAISSEAQPIAFGQLTPASMSGNFNLKGKTIPLSVPVEVEPILGDDGGPRLLMRSAFQIDLTQFEIEGADGPDPANHTLLFDVNVTLSPEGS